LIGVLALQGDFAAHARALEAAGAAVREVRTARDFLGLRGLVIPGGESTALWRLMQPEDLGSAIRAFHEQGGFLFGTCAGLILLARVVIHPPQEGLGLLNLTVERNSYGRQVDSFVSRGRIRLPGEPESQPEMVFIRAPRIVSVGPGVETLGWLERQPVLVGHQRVLAAAYHPEMSAENRVHAFFVRLVGSSTEAFPLPAAGD
jgi:5'-phosphate synthase pdxT subunit